MASPRRKLTAPPAQPESKRPSSRHSSKSSEDQEVAAESVDTERADVARSPSKKANRADLIRLIRRIEKHHGLVNRHGASMLRHACQAGMAILEAKAILPPGKLTAWLSECFGTGVGGLSLRTAQRYKRIAENLPEILRRLREASDEPDAVSDAVLLQNLSVRHALRLIAGPGRDAESGQGSLPRPAALKHASVSRRAAKTTLPAELLAAIAGLLAESRPILAEPGPGADGTAADPCGVDSETEIGEQAPWPDRLFVFEAGESRSRLREILKECDQGRISEAIVLLPALPEADWCDLLCHRPMAFVPLPQGNPRGGRLNSKTPTGTALLIHVGPVERAIKFATAFCKHANVYLPHKFKV